MFSCRSCSCKDIQQTQRDTPFKSFWKSWISFFVPSSDITWPISKFGKSFPFSRNSGRENQLRASKNILGVYLFVLVEYLCNRCSKNENKKIQKLYFIFAFASGAGDLKFKSRADQIGHSVGNGSKPQQHFFKNKLLPAGAIMRGWAPLTRYMLRCKAASKMKDRIDLIFNYW